jgi:hypothetical protein
MVGTDFVAAISGFFAEIQLLCFRRLAHQGTNFIVSLSMLNCYGFSLEAAREIIVGELK